MIISLITSLAGFSTKNPKTLITVIVVLAVGAFLVHYKLIVGERDKLLVAEAGYKAAVTAFVQREATLQADIRLEREAARVVVAERDAARRSVETFRNARQDVESVEWASQEVPAGELARLCAALPEMIGCQNTRLNN